MQNVLAKLQVAFMAQKLPLILWGVPGLGKTQIIGNWAKTVLKMPLITLHLSQMEAPDLLGLPKALEINSKTREQTEVKQTKNGTIVKLGQDWVTKYVKPSWWPTEPVVLFLDELNRAQRFEINAVHELVLDHKLFENVLPEGSYICAACNPPDQDEIGLTSFGSAFWDRFSHVQVKTDPGAWLDWAKKNGINENIISFVQAQPEGKQAAILNSRTMKFDEILTNVSQTQRSWERVSHVLDACNELGNSFIDLAGWPIITGLVGKTMCKTLKGYIATEDEPIKAEEIMKYVKRNDKDGNAINPAEDYDKERIQESVRDFLTKWTNRGDSKIPLLKTTVEQCADHCAQLFIEKGGDDTFTDNHPAMQALLGNFLEFVNLCPPSIQAVFLQSMDETWTDIINLIPLHYINSWMPDDDNRTELT